MKSTDLQLIYASYTQKLLKTRKWAAKNNCTNLVALCDQFLHPSEMKVYAHFFTNTPLPIKTAGPEITPGDKKTRLTPKNFEYYPWSDHPGVQQDVQQGFDLRQRLTDVNNRWTGLGELPKERQEQEVAELEETKKRTLMALMLKHIQELSEKAADYFLQNPGALWKYTSPEHVDMSAPMAKEGVHKRITWAIYWLTKRRDDPEGGQNFTGTRDKVASLVAENLAFRARGGFMGKVDPIWKWMLSGEHQEQFGYNPLQKDIDDPEDRYKAALAKLAMQTAAFWYGYYLSPIPGSVTEQNPYGKYRSLGGSPSEVYMVSSDRTDFNRPGRRNPFRFDPGKLRGLPAFNMDEESSYQNMQKAFDTMESTLQAFNEGYDVGVDRRDEKMLDARTSAIVNQSAELISQNILNMFKSNFANGERGGAFSLLFALWSACAANMEEGSKGAATKAVEQYKAPVHELDRAGIPYDPSQVKTMKEYDPTAKKEYLQKYVPIAIVGSHGAISNSIKSHYYRLFGAGGEIAQQMGEVLSQAPSPEFAAALARKFITELRERLEPMLETKTDQLVQAIENAINEGQKEGLGTIEIISKGTDKQTGEKGFSNSMPEWNRPRKTSHPEVHYNRAVAILITQVMKKKLIPGVIKEYLHLIIPSAMGKAQKLNNEPITSPTGGIPGGPTPPPAA